MKGAARVLLVAAYVGYVWYITNPNRAFVRPAAWLTGARTAGAGARVLGGISLACEAHYWRAVAP